uniref:Guanylate cyclase n=1 Tax=Acrobeloides nanus TaxID=290746 RepID=A0A914DTM9_9BILA
MGCGDSFEGVAVAAQMYHQEQIRCFIGPYCNTELEAVAKMGSFWNIPVISYMATTTALADRSIYKTLARISSKNTNSIARATVKLLQHYNWQRIAIVTNTGPVAFERVAAFEDEFRRANLNIVKKIMFEENWNSTLMTNSGLLSELASSARIVICLFSSTRELSREFMQATFKANMNNAEYAYILPWLQGGPKDASPWIGSSGEMLQQVKDAYQNAIITNIFGYLHLYDALKLYALAARKSYEGSGRNASQLTNGHVIWNNMRRLTFEGVGSTGDSTGTVIMDDMSDRVPLFAAFYISPNREKVIKMVDMDPILLPNCNGMVNKTGCYDWKLNDQITGFWPSENGKMPLDEPACGYRGQKCSYTLEIVAGSTIICMLIAFLVAYLLYRHCQNRSLDKMPWRIFHDDLRLLDDEQAKSLLSLGSSNTKLSNMSVGQKKHAIIGVNTQATYHKYPQKRPIKFCRADLMLLTQMKQAIHDNINPFLGMAFNEKEEMLILWKFCSRGTLQDIIYNKNMVLDEKFHAAFVRDITLGLEYLHCSPIGYHGSLSPWACVIDRNWSVRLTHYGVANPLERWEKEGAITIESLQSDADKSQAAQRTSALYCAPEMLKNRDINRRRRTSQKWVMQSQARRQAGDIYAFGMVMYEILFRALPYPEDTDYNGQVDNLGLVEMIKTGSRHVRPRIQDSMKIHPDLVALLTDCWSENPEIRPSIRRVRLNTEMVLKTKGSLVDQMMRVMEQYANNLEKLVKERSGMLEEANQRADRLLNQLLPRYVTNELKMGRAVPPKLFSSATVLFSHIVGFTDICANSTPLEIVNLLNGVFAGFDSCIQKHGAYKVETIGDAYLVVSGIPEENGTLHIMNIADIALGMREFLVDFEIPYKRKEKVKCRWGFHTGPVAAGVVGLTAPRYCLFGDTVNSASRMESTGLPEMIQLSQQSNDLLTSQYPQFICSMRGEVEVKGKGLCTTFWLDRKAEETTIERQKQKLIC